MERIFDDDLAGEVAAVINEHDDRIEALEAGSTGGGGLALGETAGTAYRGDRGKVAYDFAQAQPAINAAKADLVGGQVPSSQLPSYVDDVIEFSNLAALPTTGETGKIYITIDTSFEYRWSGSAYIRLVASPGTTDALVEGTTNKYYTDARSALKVDKVDGSRLITNSEGLTLQSVPSGDTTLYESMGTKVLPASDQTSTSLLILAPPLNLTPFQNAGKVADVYLPTAGAAGTVNCVVFRQVGTTTTYREASRTPFETTIGDNTYLLSSLNIPILAGDFVGFLRPNTTLKFKIRPNQTPNPTIGYNTPAAILVNSLYEFTQPSVSNDVGYNIIVRVSREVAGGVFSFTTKFNQIDSSIAANTAKVNTKPLNKCEFWSNNFATLPTDYVNTGWALVTGGISPTATGIANTLYLNRDYALSDLEYECVVNLQTGNRLLLYSRANPNDKISSSASSSMVELDVTNNVVKLYNGYANDSNFQGLLGTYNYTFTSGRDVLIRIIIDALQFKSSFHIIDTVTGIDTIIYEDTAGLRRWTDNLSFASLAGTNMILKSVRIGSLYTGKNIKLYVVGDSIPRGEILGETPGSSYAAKLTTLLGNGSCYSGRPSGVIVGFRNRLQTEAKILKPAYVMVGGMTNNTDAEVAAQLQGLIDDIIALPAIPILNNIPAQGTTGAVARNATIASARSSNNLYGILADVATSIGNIPANGRNSALYISGDPTHPADSGHLEITKRAPIDVPILF